MDDVTVVTMDSSQQMLEKAQLDQQVATAKQFPRSLKSFREKVLSTATITEAVAESCSYALKRDGKTITGPSVRFAEIIASSYGNLLSGATIVANDGKVITARGFCRDLETNNTIAYEVKRRITKKDGTPYSEDMQIVTGNAACAIAFRNALFKVVPAALTEDIYEQVVRVGKGTLATLADRREKAIAWFEANGISADRVYRKLEVKGIEDIDLEKLSILSGMRSAVKNEEAKITDLFEDEQAEKAKKASQEEARVEAMIRAAKNKKDATAIMATIPEPLKAFAQGIFDSLFTKAEKKPEEVAAKQPDAQAASITSQETPSSEQIDPDLQAFIDKVADVDLATMGEYDSVAALESEADTPEKKQHLQKFLDKMLARS